MYNVIPGYGNPIYAWNKYVPFEEETIEQLRQTSSLPIIYKHVAVMPDAHVGRGATIGSVLATLRGIICAAAGVDLGCFSGDTKVPLLDGSQKTMKELTDIGGEVWVYSIDPDTLKIVPGRAKALKTRSNTGLIKVTVSGGEEIVCTPDHEFMLTNGSYKEAQNLNFQDHLMPFYRLWHTEDGYEKVSNGKGNSVYTHKMVYKSFYGESPKGNHIHHVNHYLWDNRPENLVSLTSSQHSSYHRKVGHKFKNEDAEFQVLRIAGIHKSMDNPERLQSMKDVGTRNIKKYMEENPEHFKESVKDNGKRGAKYLIQHNTIPRECPDCGEYLDNIAALNWHKQKAHGYSIYSIGRVEEEMSDIYASQELNHRVISIEVLEEKEDVYCLQVEKYHNFALSSGVFVHNCGVEALQLHLKASDLPDNLYFLRLALEEAVPHGRTRNGRRGDKGAWQDGNLPRSHKTGWQELKPTLEHILSANTDMGKRFNLIDRAASHMGTLGSGNHFLELGLDEGQNVWLTLHSGSRGIGNAIGQHFIKIAKTKRFDHPLYNKDLAYLKETDEEFSQYFNAATWAQEYARINRSLMVMAAIKAMQRFLDRPVLVERHVSCHHNYIAQEQHFGQTVYVTRKGAVRAGKGDWGVIPGSMKVGSYIVRGLGNKESFQSCSHGAGRTMSRTQARKVITLEEHIEEMEGIEARTDSSVLDESPRAYKNLDDVMRSQSDLIEVVCKIDPILNMKG